MRVLALTSGRDSPPRRYRILQYADELGRMGIDLQERVPRIEKFAPLPGGGNGNGAGKKTAHVMWTGAKLLARVPGVVASWNADATWLERELIAGVESLEPLLRRPYVFDLDDAVWLGGARRSASVAKIVKRAAAVLAGNDFLADWSSQWTERVTIVPTAVDTEHFVPLMDMHGGVAVRGRRLTIGWIGTSSNFRYLAHVETALAECLSAADAELLVIADRAPPLTRLPAGRLRFRQWTADSEVRGIQAMDVGLMPLADDDWCRGKCALKMLQYMACAVPVVASRLPWPGHILDLGGGGQLAETTAEWRDALIGYCRHPEQRATDGEAGRRVVREHFDMRQVAPIIADTFRRVGR